MLDYDEFLGGAAEVDEAVLRQHAAILDADAAKAFDIDTGLNGDRGAGNQQLVRAGVGVGILVDLETEAVAEAAKLGYIPRPDFEVTSITFVNGAPTITGEVFSVIAKIKNVGETTAYPGKVALYTSHADIVEVGDTPNAVKATTQSLEPGQEMEIEFKNIKAPGEGGPHHVRVLVDADNAVDELSEGNNQLPLFYFLNNIAVSISIQGSKLTLTWNSNEGQAYTVRAATALDAFEDYIPVGSDGLDNLGYFHMPATPPYNTAVIDLDGANARFFKIRVDNLADEAR